MRQSSSPIGRFMTQCVAMLAPSLIAFGVMASLLIGCASNPPLPPKAIELNQNGAAALAAGDLETAEARLGIAIELNPRFTEAWVNLGYVELQRGHLAAARKNFVKARDLNPDLPTPHHALGLLADQRGLGKEAEGHYRQALKVDPAFLPARENLARKLFERASFDDAREQYLRLTQIQPDALQGYVGLSECYFRLDREGDASDVIGRARARFGDVPEVRMLVARLQLRGEAFAEAEETLAPLTSDPNHSRAASAWAWIAVSRKARGDAKGAKQASSESLALDPANAIARKL